MGTHSQNIVLAFPPGATSTVLGQRHWAAIVQAGISWSCQPPPSRPSQDRPAPPAVSAFAGGNFFEEFPTLAAP